MLNRCLLIIGRLPINVYNRIHIERLPVNYTGVDVYKTKNDVTLEVHLKGRGLVVSFPNKRVENHDDGIESEEGP